MPDFADSLIMKWIYRALAIAVGFVVFLVVFHRPLAVAFVAKATGGDEPCPWGKLVEYSWS